MAVLKNKLITKLVFGGKNLSRISAVRLKTHLAVI